MASCTRVVQLAQIASALLLLVFAVTTLVLSDGAGDAAKQYQSDGLPGRRGPQAHGDKDARAPARPLPQELDGLLRLLG